MSGTSLTQDDIEKMQMLIYQMSAMSLDKQRTIRSFVEALNEKRKYWLVGLGLFAVAAATVAAYITNTSPTVVVLVIVATSLAVILLILRILRIL